MVRTDAGIFPAATSATLMRSSTARRPARTATQTSWSFSAAPSYSSVSGRRPAHLGQRPVDSTHHVGDLDLRGRPREPVAALGPAQALNQSSPPQVGEDRLQELARQVLFAGDRLRFHPRIARCLGQHEHGPHRVVGLRGDMHPAMMAAAPVGLRR